MKKVNFEKGSNEIQYTLLLSLVVILIIAYFWSWCLFIDRLINPIFSWLGRLSDPYNGPNFSIMNRCPSIRSLEILSFDNIKLPSVPEISRELILSLIVILLIIVFVVGISMIVYQVAEGMKQKSQKSKKQTSGTEGSSLFPWSNRKRKEEANLELFVAHPKLLSKGYSSGFQVVICPSPKREKARRELFEKSRDSTVKDFGKTDLIPGLTVVIQLLSHDIVFEKKKVIKTLEKKIIEVNFSGKPKDDCRPGKHSVLLSITDKMSEHHEYVSKEFQVEIVDFAIDHISRPFLSRLTTIAFSIAAAVTYIFTLLGQIDTTFGLASGTTATAIAVLVHHRFLTIYQQSNTINPLIGKNP